MAAHICVRCSKTLASRQSLWNHRQRCKVKANKDEKSNEQTGNPYSTPADKEKFLANIVNNVDNLFLDSKSKKKSESESNSESTDFDSDSEYEETDTSKNNDPDNVEQLKATFRKLYRKVQSNMENFNKLVLILDKLYHVNCLTKEECDGMKSLLQKKIGIV